MPSHDIKLIMSMDLQKKHLHLLSFQVALSLKIPLKHHRHSTIMMFEHQILQCAEPSTHHAIGARVLTGMIY